VKSKLGCFSSLKKARLGFNAHYSSESEIRLKADQQPDTSTSRDLRELRCAALT
jgi:hypothetical protein